MELAFYQRFNIPIPHIAPFERHRQRLAFIINHRKLIVRTCGNCKQQVDSVYPESEFPKFEKSAHVFKGFNAPTEMVFRKAAG